MCLAELILNPRSRRALENYLKRPSHALLLTGDNGVGLGTVAESLAREIAGANAVVMKPQLHDKQKTLSINIDDIRELRQFTRDRRSDALCIVIDEAEKMTASAPEAFLKALEEPSPQTFYILTTHMPSKLPATIRSRTQIIEILPPLAENCNQLFETAKTKLSAAKQAQIIFLADRRPAEIVRYLADEEYFRQTATGVELAKKFVQGDIKQRLAIISSVSTRDTAMKLARNVARLLYLTIGRARNGKTAAENLDTAVKVIDNLHQNGNLRAQLTYLALNI
jgi:DNA polymerase III delta prime subunit